MTVANFKGIQDKNTVVPNIFLMVLRDEVIEYNGELKLGLISFLARGDI